MAVTVEGYDESVKRHVTCRACGAKLSYLKQDVRSYTARDMTGCSDTDYSITCAGCGEGVDVKPWY